MNPLSASQIRGNWATLLLPIDEQDRIDFARLVDEIDVILSFGVDGIYSNGTAGEFYTQTEAEFDRVSETLAERCEKADVAFQIGASHTSAQGMLGRIRRARALAPGAFQVILPDWFPLTDEESLDFLERIAEAADPIGLILYNPPHAKRVLDGAAMRRLAERVSLLRGAKVGNVDSAWFDALGLASAQFSVFTPGHFLAKHVPMGSAGAYSNVACLHPRGAQWFYAMTQRDPENANAFQARLLSFFDEHITPFITRERYCNAAVDKLLAAIGGWADVGTRMRWPYRSIPSENVDRLRPVARDRLPELFESRNPIGLNTSGRNA